MSLFSSFPLVQQARIEGPAEVYVQKGSTIRLTCRVNTHSDHVGGVTWLRDAHALDYDSPRCVCVGVGLCRCVLLNHLYFFFLLCLSPFQFSLRVGSVVSSHIPSPSRLLTSSLCIPLSAAAAGVLYYYLPGGCVSRGVVIAKVKETLYKKTKKNNVLFCLIDSHCFTFTVTSAIFSSFSICYPLSHFSLLLFFLFLYSLHLFWYL